MNHDQSEESEASEADSVQGFCGSPPSLPRGGHVDRRGRAGPPDSFWNVATRQWRTKGTPERVNPGALTLGSSAQGASENGAKGEPRTNQVNRPAAAG